ncbi:Flp family type IVb pilin [Salinisphaera sp. PC39]|uniref:Flp family type IVb pilin n=1 Tax=Salinisphaera sp. PC39 TaxID=1304156 RepID=UPI00333EE2E4
MLNLMLIMMRANGGFHNRQRGATLIEYALIIAAIALVVLVGSMAITGDLTSFFDTVGGELE